ncbi:MAG: ATP-binding protein [Nigerium sp.]|nr:ATP-binding protein [Nigerium sp.]
MTFESEVLVWQVALTLLLTLVVAWSVGSIARLLVRSRAHLGAAPTVLVSIACWAIGLFIAGLISPATPLWSPLTILCGLGMTLAGMSIYGSVAAHVQRPQHAPLAELVQAGESARAEFKSTARVNLHTGQRDDRIELVAAKTICAFLNDEGGTLLIGVADDGTPLGLDSDMKTLKAPDADRYELWLRDLMSTTLGQNAAALVQVEFGTLPDADGADRLLCRVTVPPSPRPVFLRPAKSGAPELWVRQGNSSRRLAVDAASEYVMRHWPLGPWANMAAQIKAAARSSAGGAPPSLPR